MAACKKHGYRLTQEEYASVYNVNRNTISKWQAKNLPLDDPEELVTALLLQRTYPRTVIEKGISEIEDDYRTLAFGVRR